MQLFFKTESDRIIVVYALPHDTIIEVKRKILLRERIRPENMVIIFHGQQLQDNLTLEQLGINDTTVFFLQIRCQIQVQLATGEIQTFGVNLLNRVADVKQMIAERLQIQRDFWGLAYKDKPLNEESILQDYDIQTEYPISIVQKIQILVKMLNGKTLRLYVCPNETVLSVKQLIHSHERIPPEDMALMFGPTKIQDMRTLDYYNIVNESQLRLKEQPQRIRIHIQRLQLPQLDLQVRLTDKVERVKFQIAQKIQIPMTQQRLSYNSQVLLNHITLEECGVQMDSTLRLIQTLEGEVLEGIND